VCHGLFPLLFLLLSNHPFSVIFPIATLHHGDHDYDGDEKPQGQWRGHGAHQAL
jgi:hypothetical protein